MQHLCMVLGHGALISGSEQWRSGKLSVKGTNRCIHRGRKHARGEAGGSAVAHVMVDGLEQWLGWRK